MKDIIPPRSPQTGTACHCIGTPLIRAKRAHSGSIEIFGGGGGVGVWSTNDQKLL